MSDFEDAVKQCYSTWGTTYYDEYYGDKAPYPPLHCNIVLRILHENNVKDMLDAGCGPASFLRDITDQGMDLFGFDITPEMVDEAQRILLKKGLTTDRIWCGSVLDISAYQYPSDSRRKKYDAVVSIGVLPHIPESGEVDFLKNVYASVKENGLAIIEARNQLFALFTLNRYSYEFMMNDLIEADKLRVNAGDELASVENIFQEMKRQFRMDSPPIRRGKKGEPGYDEILSRTHNPYVLKERFSEVGFKDVKIYFYHYHCLPPMFESVVPELFVRESIKLEEPDDWRGYFMASAFLIVGKKQC